MTAMDAAGDGGELNELASCLPHLDLYCPSINEARKQTGCDSPDAILAAYRDAGAAGIVGVKLGEQGAVLSDTPGELIPIPPVTPPGPVVDTTGAGDCFLGGLLAGLLKGLDLYNAGRIAAACGARCVTALGATTTAGDYEDTLKLAGVTPEYHDRR